MIFRYKYYFGNITPGVFIRKDSVYSGEKEIITKIYFDIVNKNTIMEFQLNINNNYYLD